MSSQRQQQQHDETETRHEVVLAALWPALEAGCGSGVHLHTTGVPTSKVRAVLDVAQSTSGDSAALRAVLVRAGSAAVFCALHTLFHRHLGQLRAQGRTTDAWTARLAAALARPHPHAGVGGAE